jgi:hypothetical protein
VAAFPGGIGTLSPQFVKKADESLFTTGSALYSYDLQDQDRTTLEATGQAYFSRHFRVRDFDLVYLEGTFGPRTTLASYGVTGFTTRPYLIADYVRLGGDPLFHAFGAGLEAAQAILPDLVLKGVYELREKRYYDTRDRVTAPDLSGLDNGVSLQLSYALTPDQLVTGTLSFLDENARADHETNRQYGVALAYQIAYAAPFGWNAAAGSWQTALSGGRTIYNYAAPNPVIDPTTERFDRRWRFTIGQLVPLTAGTALNLQLQRDIVSSSIPNFAYTNTSVVIGLQLRF